MIQDVEKLKKELRQLIWKKLRALKKSDNGEEEDPYTLKQRLNLLKFERELGNITSKRDNDTKEPKVKIDFYKQFLTKIPPKLQLKRINLKRNTTDFNISPIRDESTMKIQSCKLPPLYKKIRLCDGSISQSKPTERALIP